jgi:FkbM family methyltransferase
MLRTFFGGINRSPIWKRSVKVWGSSFVPPTLDRWLVLQAHRLKLMGNDEMLFLRAAVQGDSRIADVGANQGLYTLLLASLVPEGQIYAFEPDHLLCCSLQQNLQRNNIQNVSLFNAAVASKPGTLRLMEGQLNRGDNRIVSSGNQNAGITVVPAVALDGEIPDLRLDLLKIDVQGFELEVLQGAEKLIQTNPNLLLLLEFWPHGLHAAGCKPEELLDFLTSRGFAVYQLGRKLDCLSFEFRPEDWTKPSRFCDLVATRDIRTLAERGIKV